MNYPCLGGFSSSSWASYALALQVLCTRYLELRPRYLAFSRLETAKQLPPLPAASSSPLHWGTAAPLLHRLRRLQPRTRALAFAPGPLRQAPSPNPRPSQHQSNSTDTTKKRHLHPLLPTHCLPPAVARTPPHPLYGIFSPRRRRFSLRGAAQHHIFFPVSHSTAIPRPLNGLLTPSSPPRRSLFFPLLPVRCRLVSALRVPTTTSTNSSAISSLRYPPIAQTPVSHRPSRPLDFLSRQRQRQRRMLPRRPTIQ